MTSARPVSGVGRRMIPRSGVLAAGLALVLVLVLAACGGSGSRDGSTNGATGAPGPDPTTASPGGETTAASPRPPRVVETVASGLSVPWGVAFLPDGSALVTERDRGHMLHVIGERGARVVDLGPVPGSRAEGESGLLGIAVSPTFDRDHRVFLYTSTATDNRVLRTTFRGGRLAPAEPILTGIPHGFIHDGGRLQFGPDGYLYVSTGETGNRDLAQDKGSLAGKILRITQAGKAAPGNPFGSPVWSYGHRNVQGLAFDDAGHLWASEFGQDRWDELNLIEPGVDYGWPLVEGRGDRPGLRNPQVVWHTDEASPSGLAFLDGRLWLASLHGARLWRVDIHGARASKPTDFFVGKSGRLRAVVPTPDGKLWVTTSNRDGRGDPGPRDDRILLVDPGQE